MPLQRRLPKRGFHNPFRAPSTAIVNLGQLEARFDGGARGRRGGAARARAGAQPRRRSSASARATLTQGADRQGARLQRRRAQERIDAAGGSVEVIDGA